MSELSVDEILSWASPSTRDDWEQVRFPSGHQNSHVSLRWRPFEKGGTVVTLESELDAELGRMGFPLPEMMSQVNYNEIPNLPDWARARVERTHGPGVATIMLPVGETMRRYSQRAKAFGVSVVESEEDDTENDFRRAVFVRRSNHPERGHTAFVVAPIVRQRDRAFVMSQLGGIVAHLKVLCPHPTRRDVVLFKMTFHCKSGTTNESIMPQLCGMLQFDLKWFDLLSDPHFTHIRVPCSTRYTILSMRGFCKGRGLPLLPISLEDVENGVPVVVETGYENDGTLMHWTFWPHDTFYLAEYLESFQIAMRLPPFKTYTTYDGLQDLVSYQVAVERSQWNSRKDNFLAAFVRQRSAYRRLNGGSSTPKLKEVDDPKFSREPGSDEVSAWMGIIDIEEKRERVRSMYSCSVLLFM